ncbi:MAG: hypothetical protein JWM11_6212 [Planctomycetaceae bacterium]|nr:hypothetical protein [Planctomycetaceae bacterium]
MQLELMVSKEAQRIVKQLFPFAECRPITTSHGVAQAIFADPASSAQPIGDPHPCDSGAWISAALWHEEPE